MIKQKLSDMNKALYELFDIFNKHYYKGELIEPVIVVQTNGRNKHSMGWCTIKQVWKDEDSEQQYYEITVCAEYLYQDVEEIVSTLLHEMVHLYCRLNDVKETSRGVRYHNNKFKEIAETHGLIIEHNQSIGYSISKLTDESKKLIGEQHSFMLTRSKHRGEGETLVQPEDKPQVTRKIMIYVCPECGVEIRSMKPLDIICGVCESKFELKGGLK